MTDKVISMADFRATQEALENNKDVPEMLSLQVDTEALADAAELLYAFIEGEPMTPQELAIMYMGLFIELEPLKEFLLELAGDTPDA